MKHRLLLIGICMFLLTLLTPHIVFAESILTWDQGTDEIIGYRIYYSHVLDGYVNNIEVGNIHSYPLSGLPLTEGITYYLIVRAYNAAGESGNSNVITYVAPDNTPPAQPQGLSADSEKGSLSWMANAEADLKEYRVYYGKSAGSYSPFIPVGKMTGHVFSGLEPGVQYYCAVTAVDESGNESGYSSTVMLTPPSGVDSSPVTTDSGPVLSWTASSGVVTGYRVYYGTTPGLYPDSWHAGTATQVALSELPLEEGKTYYFVVRAYNESGESENSDVVSWTTASTAPDTEKPILVISMPTTNATYDTTASIINLAGTASDNKGIAQVSWKNSRGGNGIASGTADWSVSGISLAEGENILTVSGVDVSGNLGVQVLTVYYLLPDTTPPVEPDSSPDLAISNLKVASGKTYPVREGLSNGSVCYIDRSYVYTEVPSYLLGAVYIQPANNDKLRTDSVFLSFDINTAAIVYVVFDDRYPVPSWLSGFIDTGDRLRTESRMKIFSKEYAAGKVALNGNGHGGNHYTVMAVRKTNGVEVSISNLKAASGKTYPVREGLANGSVCYTDRSYVYSEVPSYLLGSVYIQPANNDKLRTDSVFLSFDINTAAIVYVVFDDRYPVPSWLSGFIDTGDRLRTESRMKIFSKEYAAGKVALNGNGHGGNHYTVMAVSRTGIVIDEEAPKIVISSPVDASTYETDKPSLALSGTATDNVGVVKVSWKNMIGFDSETGGEASGTESWFISSISLMEGENTIVVTALDKAGNRGTASIKITYTPPDTVSPEIQIQTPVLGPDARHETSLPSIDLKGIASDDSGKIAKVVWENSMGGNGMASGTSDWSISGVSLAEGDNIVTITATDAAGNAGVYAATIAYRIPESTPPSTIDLQISNLTAASGKSYQVKQGLANGSMPYIDRSYVYSEVPTYLLQATYIKTANDDKLRTDKTFLTFDINTPATVYVVYDDRKTPPSWLSGFTNTGDRLRTESLMKIFSKDYPAGKVTLSGNSNSGNHYTVLIVGKSIDYSTVTLDISNLTAASGKSYQVKQGLANGSLPYIDRSYVYSEVPTYLLRAMYIRTANDDKLRNDNIFMSFTINKPVTVYVVYDDRKTPPSWLSGFTNTGDRLRTESLMKIFSKDYPAGKVTLGGNSNSGNHYTVAVVAK